MSKEKDWEYVNVSPEQISKIDHLIGFAKRQHGVHRSRAYIVSEALADYFQKSDIKEQLTS